MKKILVALLIITFFNSCSDNKKDAIQNSYFDLSTFMNSEIEKLYQHQLSVLKTAIVNGESEQHRYPAINWKREFESFYAADIYKTSLNEKYMVDTLVHSTDSSKTFIIRYVAKEEELKTRVIEVYFDAQKNVTSIKVEMFTKNFVAVLSESLLYYPGKFYRIANQEESRWFGNAEFVIEGQIEKWKPEE